MSPHAYVSDVQRRVPAVLVYDKSGKPPPGLAEVADCKSVGGVAHFQDTAASLHWPHWADPQIAFWQLF